MDLTLFQPADTVAVEILYPKTRKKTGLTVYMRHRTSKEVAAVQASFSREIAKLRGKDQPADMFDRFVDRQIIAAAASWAWGEADEGCPPCVWPFPEDGSPQHPELTAERVRKLLRVPMIREQLAAGFSDEDSFFRGDQSADD
jgi:hypothetical protein